MPASDEKYRRKGILRDDSVKKLIYVIQKHHARSLHWDFRLEMDGTLKSWAVPKEPPAKPGVRRLAVQVSDHDLSYADFEGEIPKGGYGAGKVEIWDKGFWVPVETEEDKMVFEVKGEKLSGTYCLIRTGMGGNDRNWLLFKKNEK